MKTSSRRLARRHAECLHALESLEGRMVFSAPYDFAAVGVRYDGGPRVFVTEGVIDGSDVITGTTRSAGFDGVESSAPSDWTGYVRGSRGAFTFNTANGFTPYASQEGTQFISEERWKMGSFVGRDGNGAVRDLAYLVQTVDEYIFAGDMQMTRLTSTGELETFRVYVIPTNTDPMGSSYDFTYFLPSGTVTDTKQVISAGPGRWEFDTGEILFVSADVSGTAGVFIDMNDDDGIVGFATGQRTNSIYPAGAYRSAVTVTGEIGAELFGIDTANLLDGFGVANVVVQLNYISDGGPEVPSMFSIFREDEWEAGLRNPIVEGVLTARDESIPGLGDYHPIVFDLDAGNGVTLTVRPGAYNIFFASVSDGSATEQLQGAGSSVMNGLPAGIQEFIPHVDPNGRPIIYLQLGNGTDPTQQLAVDLIEESDGELVSGPLTVWMSSGGFDHYVAGRSVDGDVLLWTRWLNGGGWAFFNLTELLDGARPIVSDLYNTGQQTSAESIIHEVVPSQGWTQALAGFDANGDMVVYMLDRFQDPQGPLSYNWKFVDVEAGGIDNGVIPDIVGGLSGWSASWGAVHFAGVDSSGDLWSIWWGNGMAQWRVDNLSAESGADPLFVGRPSAVQTSWDAFHIFTTDTSGNVVVTWWGVGLGQWRYQNLTEDFSGPTVQPGSVVGSYIPQQRTLNSVGLDDQGDAIVYWWNFSFGWKINTLSNGISPSLVPQGPWTMSWAAYDTEAFPRGMSQSLFGTNLNGDLVRLTWRSKSADAWLFENITDISQPFFV